MNPYDTLWLEYSNLTEGERKSAQLCPKCNGGRTHERSLSISRSNGALRFICFRASCNFKGTLRGVSGSSATPYAVGSAEEPAQVSAVLSTPLPEELAEQLATKYNTEVGMFGWAKWCYSKVRARVGMPIIGPDYSIRGMTWRSYSGAVPKALIERLKPGEEMMCWYRARQHGRTLVITEDQPSALRVASQGVDALALCGVLLSLDRVYEIKAQEYKKIFLCLDEDATNVAIRHSVEYKARLPQLHVMQLSEDIKDMSADDFELFIQEVSLP